MYHLFFYKNYVNFLLFLVFPGCSGMFKNFRVPGFIDVPNIQLSELFKVIRKKFMLFVFNFWLHEEI